jgi:hypothetical protein
MAYSQREAESLEHSGNSGLQLGDYIVERRTSFQSWAGGRSR